MSSLGDRTWLKSPTDRQIIDRWTVGAENNPTHALIVPPPPDPNNFEFLALGDTGDSDTYGSEESPQEAVARYLTEDANVPGGSGIASMVIHTGDVIYMTGERRLYDQNFRKPYAPFLSPESSDERYVFRIPFLPVPGNHDYYDLNGWVRWIGQIPLIGGGLRRLARHLFGFSLPKGGSDCGRAFMEVFVTQEPGLGSGPLPYVPGKDTRLPNRYYQFSVGTVDFFGLDSNTLDTISPGRADEIQMRTDAAERIKLLEERARELETALKSGTNPTAPPADVSNAERKAADSLPENQELAEKMLDVQRDLAYERRLLLYTPQDYDADQIEWLRTALEESVRLRPDAWRIVYLHHPLYSSISNHCEGKDVQGVRTNLLPILQDTAHLVLSGHSHSFEWITSADLPNTGIFVTGGGGQATLCRSLLHPRNLTRHRDKYQLFRNSGAKECAAAGKGPPAMDGENGKLYHYLRVQVSPEALTVRPIGVRSLEQGYRREVPMAVYYANELPEARHPSSTRLLECVHIRRGEPPEAVWG